MKKPKLKAFKAWIPMSNTGQPLWLWWNSVTKIKCRVLFCAPTERHVRVVVRDVRDDEATKLRRENARLRRALRFYSDADAYSVKRIGAGLVVGTVFADRGGIARAALRKGGAK